MLNPITEALVSKGLWPPFTLWTVFSMGKKLWQKGAKTPWIIPGAQLREEMSLRRISLCLIVFIKLRVSHHKLIERHMKEALLC